MTAKRQKRRKLRILLLTLTAMLCVVVYAVDSQIRPVIIDMSKSKAEYMATIAINEAIDEELEKAHADYNSLVNIEYDEDNNVKSLHTDIAKLNMLKAAITSNAINRISSYTSNEIGIRAGNLLGNDFFTGRGPIVKVKLQVASSAQSDVLSKFENSGINQTHHSIMLHVKFSIYTLIPGYNSSVDVDTNFCLAETVIVGSVPDSYTYIDGIMNEEQFDAFGNYQAEPN